MNYKKLSIALILLSILIFSYKKCKQIKQMPNTNNNDSISTPDDQAAEKMSTLSVELETTTNNINDTINKHKDYISDIHLKILSIPNIIFTLAITNVDLRSLILAHHILSISYLATLFTFLALILFNLITLHITNYDYIQHKNKLTAYSNKLNGILDINHIPNEVLQREMISCLQKSPVTKKISTFRFLTNLFGFINIISFILFIICTSYIVIIKKEPILTTNNNQTNSNCSNTQERRVPVNESQDPKASTKHIPVQGSNQNSSQSK